MRDCESERILVFDILKNNERLNHNNARKMMNAVNECLPDLRDFASDYLECLNGSYRNCGYYRGMLLIWLCDRLDEFRKCDCLKLAEMAFAGNEDMTRRVRERMALMGCENPLTDCVEGSIVVPVITTNWESFSRKLQDAGGFVCLDTVRFDDVSLVSSNHVMAYRISYCNWIIVELDNRYTNKDDVIRSLRVYSEGAPGHKPLRVTVAISNYAHFARFIQNKGRYNKDDYLRDDWGDIWQYLRNYERNYIHTDLDTFKIDLGKIFEEIKNYCKTIA